VPSFILSGAPLGELRQGRFEAIIEPLHPIFSALTQMVVDLPDSNHAFGAFADHFGPDAFLDFAEGDLGVTAPAFVTGDRGQNDEFFEGAAPLRRSSTTIPPRSGCRLVGPQPGGHSPYNGSTRSSRGHRSGGWREEIASREEPLVRRGPVLRHHLLGLTASSSPEHTSEHILASSSSFRSADHVGSMLRRGSGQRLASLSAPPRQSGIRWSIS
jgi:hypothetical protein